MIHTRYAKHPDYVQRHTDPECRPAKSNKKDEEASEVNAPEGGLLDDIKGMKGISNSIHERLHMAHPWAVARSL